MQHDKIRFFLSYVIMNVYQIEWGRAGMNILNLKIIHSDQTITYNIESILYYISVLFWQNKVIFWKRLTKTLTIYQKIER